MSVNYLEERLVSVSHTKKHYIRQLCVEKDEQKKQILLKNIEELSLEQEKILEDLGWKNK